MILEICNYWNWGRQYILPPLFSEILLNIYILHLLTHLYRYQLYVDILVTQYSRTRRRKCVRAKRCGHCDDGDADRGPVTIIKNRHGKSPSKRWGVYAGISVECKDSMVWLKAEPNTSSVFETATYTVLFLSTSSPFWRSKQIAGFTPKQVIKYYQHDYNNYYY